MGEIFGRPFDLLLGRKTYDIFAAHWPYSIDPKSTSTSSTPIAARTFNRATKYVATALAADARLEEQRVAGQRHRRDAEGAQEEDGPTC